MFKGGNQMRKKKVAFFKGKKKLKTGLIQKFHSVFKLKF